VGVDHGGFLTGVSELGLDGADVVIGLQRMGGIGMTKGMGRDNGAED
jgi:hypothetical protein